MLLEIALANDNHLLWLIDARLFELEKPTWAWKLDVGMDRFLFLWLRLPAVPPPVCSFVANSFSLVSLKISKNYDDAEDVPGARPLGPWSSVGSVRQLALRRAIEA